MKLRSPILIRIVAALAALLVRLWMMTMRIRMVTGDGQAHPVDPRVKRYVYAFWHETMLAPLATRAKAKVLVSQHADGELIAQVCKWLGVGAIRGSTARGGSQALLEMIRDEDQHTHLAITPDGPRGPRRELKPGLVMVASQTGMPIVLIGVGFTKAWRAQSWDRFALPYPFSTLVGVIGHPIDVPAELDRGQMQHYQQIVNDQLLHLTHQAEDWALRLAREGRHASAPAVLNATMRKSA